MSSAAGVSSPQDTRRSPVMRYGLLPVLVVLACLAVTVIVVLVLRSQTQKHEHDDLQAATERAAEQIESRFDLYAEQLFDLRPLFEGDPGRTSRAGFQSWLEVSGVFERLPGIQALEFTRVVAAEDRETFEAAVRQDTSLNGVGYPEFEVQPDSQATHLFVVDFVEPMKGNEAAFGFDLGSNSVRRLAVETARDTGDLAATAPITLVQETGEQKG
ncbi:MAG: CHASE domain-containing protein, partial [Actinomycetia bacterium]|nr:CHASE domain-containing protein [Actinomycetes bacterium]